MAYDEMQARLVRENAELMQQLREIQEQHREDIRMQVAMRQEVADQMKEEIAKGDARLREAQQALSQSETIRIMHARKQGAADGFQDGWRAALKRVSEGGAVADLLDLVPTFDAFEKLAEAHADLDRAALTVTAITRENEQLRGQLEQAEAARDEWMRESRKAFRRGVESAREDPK